MYVRGCLCVGCVVWVGNVCMCEESLSATACVGQCSMCGSIQGSEGCVCVCVKVSVRVWVSVWSACKGE